MLVVVYGIVALAVLAGRKIHKKRKERKARKNAAEAPFRNERPVAISENRTADLPPPPYKGNIQEERVHNFPPPTYKQAAT